MKRTYDARLEIRLTQRMKRRIERAAARHGTTPSRLLRRVFHRWDERDRGTEG